MQENTCVGVSFLINEASGLQLLFPEEMWKLSLSYIEGIA